MARLSGRAPNTVLLLEHPSVYTAGKRTAPDERPDDGTPVIDVDRGGKITWHGPGQLVGYPIVRLAEPYPPLPETSEHVDILHITRTWRFLPEGRVQND